MITFLGFFAAGCTTLAFLPQTLRIIKSKQTKDLSLITYVIYVVGLAAWIGYGVLIQDFVIITGSIISLMLGLTIMIFILKYK